MLRRYASIFLCLIALNAAVIVAALAEPSPRIESIRFGTHPGYYRIVAEVSSTISCTVSQFDSKGFTLSCTPFVWSAGQPAPNAGARITFIRPQQGPRGQAQIQVGTSGPMHVAKIFSVAGRDGKPPRLVIDYQPQDSAGENIATTYADTSTDASLNGDGDGGAFDTMLNTLASPQGEPEQPMATAGGIRLPGRKPAPPASGLQAIGQTLMDSVRPAPVKDPFIVVIDAGHGGTDPGATAVNGTLEKNIVLGITRELRDQLRADPRYRVFLTRDNDRFIKLADRVKIARQHKADLFISIHADSLPSKRNAEGASFYTISKQASDAQTAKLAEKENKADLLGGVNIEHEDRMVENILLDLITRDTVNHSKFFASQLMAAYRHKNLKTLTPAHRSAGFAVLKAADIPSVLIEVGFLSNPDEARRLSDLDERRRIADVLKSAIDLYVPNAQSGF
ncbi:MAG: N-acetylmuramoyl-L-alanine amidase [Pseudomonadota bacterium]